MATRRIADVTETDMSPLQKRLLATYMNALDEQEEKYSDGMTDDDDGMTTAPAPAPTPPPPPAVPILTPEVGPMLPTPTKSRSDIYAKKMGDLLLKGWRMLGENCPETGEVPLMAHPTTGRKFSIATGRYTDELPPPPVAPAPAPAPASAPAPAPAPAPSPPSSPGVPAPPRAAASKSESGKSESDLWCEHMSQLMLKGWTMLNETCPVTQAVPLMGQPRTGRKFSVAVMKFLDELEAPAAAPAAPADVPASTAPTPAPAPPMRTSSAGVSCGPVHEPSSLAAVQHPQLPNMVPYQSSFGQPSVTALAPAPSTPAAVASTDAIGTSLASLLNAAAVLSQQMSITSAQLATAPSPPPLDLIQAISEMADSMTKVGLAYRQLSRA